jgi:hypothetical protein
VAARAFGEDGVLAVQLHAELEVVGRLAVLADAHVAGGHALDAPSSLYSTSAAGKPGKISTPSASACSASQRTTLPRLTM